MTYSPEIEHSMRMFHDSLSEKDRRRYAAIEAAKLGHGGTGYISTLLGCDPKTIRIWINSPTGSTAGSVKRGRAEEVYREHPAPGGELPPGHPGPHGGRPD